MHYLCPKCHKSREAAEKIVEKDGQHWLIEFCIVCLFNFELTEFDIIKKRRRIKYDPKSQ